ncbi:hypothetical protein AAFN86_23370 [Roseomonas sp. CAU 1739]|uniref:hypothetical protein n=1 Tax=Roseomonas sp. CAU 1739 TaxID=3140364 RepID=UPI00325AF6AB
MTLFILDPNLDRENGHHLEWDLAVARAARARGEPVVIFAHRDFPAEQAEGIAIRPWFTFTTYARAAQDPVAGRYDDFHLFNETLADDLAAIEPGTFRAGDAVLAPTLNENHLLGYASWMKGFDPSRAPLFLLHLMFDPGLADGGDGAPVVRDALTALFYQLGQRRAAEPGPQVHLFATGQQMSRDFSALFAQPVPPHPIPVAPRRTAPRPDGARPACLLFIGDAKPDKGVLLLPGLAEAIAAAQPDWDVLLHVNETTAWGPARQTCEELAALAARRANVTVQGGRLPRDAYQRLMESASLLVCTHEPAAYARKSSGILWEAVGLGLPVVVPHGTWLEREAAEWGAGAVAAHDWTIAGLHSAFEAAVVQRAVLARASAEAAQRFHAANGAGGLIEQIWALWRPSLPVQARPPVPALGAPDAPAVRAAPEAPRAAVQWMGHAAELTFAWPPGEAWHLDVDTGAQVLPENVAVEAGAAPGTARILVAAEGGDNRDGQVRLRVMLSRPARAVPPAPVPPAVALPAPVPQAVAEPAAPPVEAFRIGQGRDAVAATRVTLDELLPGEVYRHLDLTLHGLTLGAEAWARVKFKICCDRDARHLEFRRMHGWPEMFVEWPGTAYDQYGEVLHIAADGTPVAVAEARDRALLTALARCLKEAVRCLWEQNPLHAEALETWLVEAELHQRSLAVGLRAATAQASAG